MTVIELSHPRRLVRSDLLRTSERSAVFQIDGYARRPERVRTYPALTLPAVRSAGAIFQKDGTTRFYGTTRFFRVFGGSTEEPYLSLRGGYPVFVTLPVR